MGLYHNMFASPYYPADAVYRHPRPWRPEWGLDAQYAKMMVNEYKKRHNGKSPARIFLTEEMFLAVSNLVHFDVKTSSHLEGRLFGIPVSLIGGKEKDLYLSDEEEEDPWND